MKDTVIASSVEIPKLSVFLAKEPSACALIWLFVEHDVDNVKRIFILSGRNGMRGESDRRVVL
jgi:hypothetical protein